MSVDDESEDQPTDGEQPDDPALGFDSEGNPGEDRGSTAEQQQDFGETHVVGVPLMDGERPVHETHPSWWKFLPEMLYSGVLFGIVGTLIVWIYTPLIAYPIPSEVMLVFNEGYAFTVEVVGNLGYEMAPRFSIPWWVWAIAFLLSAWPIVKAYLRARFQHYVITTERVMSIRTFPGRAKDSAKIKDIKSHTTVADFVEQRLGVGTLKFQPPNDDPIIFDYMNNYERWETKVEELESDETEQRRR